MIFSFCLISGVTFSCESTGRVSSSVWQSWFWWLLRQHQLKEAQSPWWRTGELWFRKALHEGSFPRIFLASQGRVKRLRIKGKRTQQPSVWWRRWQWNRWERNQDWQASLCWTLLLQQATWHPNRVNDTKVQIPISEQFTGNFAHRQPCIGLCYLNKLRLSKGMSGIKWRRGWVDEETNFKEIFFVKSSSFLPSIIPAI